MPTPRSLTDRETRRTQAVAFLNPTDDQLARDEAEVDRILAEVRARFGN